MSVNYQVMLPKKLRLYCSKCKVYLADMCTVDVDGKNPIYFCEECFSKTKAG